ncbi:PhnE/PtxC family ABC transporter permease [Enterococcus sp.]|uniref:PhnE/PtxC family ABC transporter permease n=1 Tax=Enterococcus sp. TaxID=35783 RepID=UPI0037BF03D9
MTWFWCCVFMAILLLALFTLDYSSLSTFSLTLGQEVISGLGKADWSFFYDGSGEDLVSLLLLTLGIACLGTMIATVLAIPITLISAANLWQSAPWVAKFGKMICNILRAFPELVYAIIFVKVVGPGPFAGVMAIGVHQIGMLGKLFTEEMEAMNDHLIEEAQAVGANFWQTMFFVRVPYLAPIYSSFALNHFEIAVRSAATLGLVGAGGIGAPLIFAIQTRTWSKVSIILLGVVVTVFLLDQLTGIIRKKLR